MRLDTDGTKKPISRRRSGKSRAVKGFMTTSGWNIIQTIKRAIPTGLAMTRGPNQWGLRKFTYSRHGENLLRECVGQQSI